MQDATVDSVSLRAQAELPREVQEVIERLASAESSIAHLS
jgi:hypothetical protein